MTREEIEKLLDILNGKIQAYKTTPEILLADMELYLLRKLEEIIIREENCLKTFKSPEDGAYLIQFKREEEGEEKSYIVAADLKKGEVITFPENSYLHSVKLGN